MKKQKINKSFSYSINKLIAIICIISICTSLELNANKSLLNTQNTEKLKSTVKSELSLNTVFKDKANSTTKTLSSLELSNSNKLKDAIKNKFNAQNSNSEKDKLNLRIKEEELQDYTNSRSEINNSISKLLQPEIISNQTECPRLCSKCALGECLECASNAIFYEGKCVLSCPKGTYLSKTFKSCYPCHISCPVCWDGLSNTCGLTENIPSVVTNLQDEIVKYIKTNGTKGMPQEESSTWIPKLNIVLKEEMRQNDSLNLNKNTLSFRKASNYNESGSTFKENDLSKNDVYQNYYDNFSEIELPLYSFSVNDGVLILIPGYNNELGTYIPSHWVYHQGYWSGREWNKDWRPKCPVYIKYKGDKTKIYYENGGYWFYDSGNGDWSWLNKSIQADSNNIYYDDQANSPRKFQNLGDVINNLNSVKLDVR